MNVDFGQAASDYARHRAGFPDAFFERLSSFGVGAPGQRVLDLGTGTGTLARGLTRRGCSVVALDPSTALVTEARRLDHEAGLTVSYLVATTERNALADDSFDVVTAGQCWHWFDRPAAAREVRRLLVPGGRLVIAHFDWLPLPGNVVEATEQLIERHNPDWDLGGGDGFHTEWVSDVTAAGFANAETFSFDVPVPYGHEAWRGRVRACSGVGAALTADRVERFDADLKRLLADRFPVEPLAVAHRVFAVICLAPDRRPAR
ncbi:MAG TPA: class I SAM-dependent methyltransferase [Phycisphaerae bacterium]|nr:class I SAM-dependent methyltransferase [Phycisphaerae bacterium]